ncbi:MAG: HAMP domain-containing protein [Planctomycetota bacterium]|nr:MAG: HAMP domain-containing protein [Planctomycetota bacterium]
MQPICPECFARYEGPIPRGETRLRCRHCGAPFLVPVEILRAQLEQAEASGDPEALEQAAHALRKTYREQRRALRRTYRQALERLRRRRRQQREALRPDDGDRIRTPLARRLLRSVLGVYFVTMLLVNLGLMAYQYVHARSQILDELRSTERIFGKGLDEALWNLDTSGVAAIARGMLEDPAIIGVRITDDRGQEVSALGWVPGEGEQPRWRAPDDADAPRSVSPTDAPRKLIRYRFELHHDDGTEHTLVGAVEVLSSESMVLARVTGGWLLLGLNALLVGLALALTLRWAVRRQLDRPLGVLTNAVSQLNMDNLDMLEVELPGAERNELRVLADAFNAMVRNLVEEKRRLLEVSRALERFVPRQLLDRLAAEGLASLEPGQVVRGRMTVLWATLLLASPEASADPETEIERACTLAERFHQAIERQGGFVYALTERSLMVLFDHEDEETEALCALYAGIDMSKSVAETPETRLAIGIDRGDVVLGTVGTRGRIDATAIGPVVACARRLMEAARESGGGLLVTEAVASRTAELAAVRLEAIELGSVLADASLATTVYAVELPAATAAAAGDRCDRDVGARASEPA